MPSKKLILSIICICLVLSIVAYQVLNTQLQATNATNSPNATTSPTSTPTNAPASSGSSTSTPTPTSTSSSSSGTSTSNTDTSGNAAIHEDSADYVWNSSEVIDITFSGTSVTSNSPNISVDGAKATITAEGTYRLTGALSNGQVVVDSQGTGTVRLILAGVDITCSNSAPLYILNSEKTIIILEANTQNHLTYTSSSTTEPNAALYSKDDLTIYGDGTLSVTSTYNDGITSNDGLILKSGTVTVNAQDDGVRGKNYLIVEGGKITVTAGENAFISDNTADSTKGYVSMSSGTVTLTSGGDAIDAQTDVIISGGQVTVTSGGGSSSSLASGISAKGIKGVVSIVIDGGTINANSADDALHSNGTITINGGTLSISTGDDGIHADSAITITAGTIDITKSYEGIEAETITINGGTIYLVSSDDGINGAGGNDQSGFGGGPGGRGGGDAFMNSGSCNLYVNGGYIVVTAAGDGIDINGAITMTAGSVIVNGPTSNNNGALDFSSFKMTGGFLIAVGSSGMAQALSTTSTQCSVLVNFQSSYSAGTLISIQSSSGTDIVTFKTSKLFQSVVVCSPKLTQGTTYNVLVGGSSTGTLKDGVYSGGTYSGGTQYTSFTITSVVTSIGGRF
ncbi:MAG: carbohydrate-binding domain-containing protein [Candidatus Bathyarchaeota archaeon]|nr:carbohydrate-binding domain-containing protein [Candidatus Bathyarchaeota archaeon]